MTPVFTDRETFTHWEVVSSERLVSALPYLEVFLEKVRLPTGKIVDDYYQVSAPDVTVVVAQTPVREVVLQRLYRHGLRNVSWSLPGGSTEPGENPLSAAKRELAEETGFVSDHWVPLSGVFQDGCRRGYFAHIFMAFDVRKEAAVHNPDLERHEVWLATWSEVLDLVAQGGFLEMGAVCSILAAHLHLQRTGG